MKYLKTFEKFEDLLLAHELPGTPDDAKFKVGDNVRVVRGWSIEDYADDGETLLWDDTIYRLQRYYRKDKADMDYECELLDYRDKGFFVVHESQLEFVPEYEVTGNKFNL